MGNDDKCYDSSIDIDIHTSKHTITVQNRILREWLVNTGEE